MIVTSGVVILFVATAPVVIDQDIAEDAELKLW